MMRVLILLLCLCCNRVPAAGIAYIDLADAYESASALKQLIPQLDAAMAAIRTEFEQKRQPLIDEIEALKTSRMHEDARRDIKRQLLLKLAALEQDIAARQQKIAKANEQATTQVDAEIIKIEAELRAEYGLRALLRTQDLLYFDPASPLNLSAELYRRLNARLPSVELKLPSP